MSKPTSPNAHPKVKQFYRALKSQKNKNTAYNYSRNAQRLLEFTEADPKEITPLDVQDWLEHRREMGDSDSSIAQYASTLRRFFREIGEYDLSKSITIPDYQQEEPDWIKERNKIRQLIDSTRYLREKAILAVGYEEAMRAGEIPKLQVEQFRPEENKITVRRLKHRGKPNEYALPIRDWCVDILKQWLGKRQSNSEQIFPFTPQTASNIFKRTAKKTDIPREYSFHCLRHSRITHAAIDMLQNQGTVDLTRLAKFAGHLQPKTTWRYTHLASEHLGIPGPKSTEVDISSQKNF